MAAFGLKQVAVPVVQELGLWPENWAAFKVYRRLHLSQWRMGPGGLIGLEYAALPFFLRLEGVPKGEWVEVTTGVQQMEVEAVQVMREKANR